MRTVGLSNQGATCYLNALLKILFAVPAFANAVFENSSESQILLALQNLFALLLHSRRDAVSTKQLTTAFGWTRSDVFEQHDALELFALLLDVVERESSNPEAAAKIFKGTSTDALKCPECGFHREIPSQFTDIALSFPQEHASMHLLTDLIKRAIADEVLAEDSAWQCSQCDKKVRATKSLSYSDLPPALMFNIKRTLYDAAKMSKIKVSDPVLFPLELTSKDVNPSSTEDVAYVLTGVLLHSGTARGGHYRALTREIGDADAFVCREHNDAHVSELSPEALANILWYDRSCDLSTISSASNMLLYEGASVLIYQREDAVRHANANRALIPRPVMDMVEADNVAHDESVQNALKYNKSTNLHVSVVGYDGPQLNLYTIELLSSLSLSDAVRAVYEFVASDCGTRDLPALPDASLCRIRRYDPSSKVLGETFGGREGDSLAVLGLGVDFTPPDRILRVPEGCYVALEFRKPDSTFQEFSGREMQLHVVHWSMDEASVPQPRDSATILVEGGEKATLGALIDAIIASNLNLGANKEDLRNTLSIMKDTPKGPVVLTGLDKILRKDFHLFSGSGIIVEVLTAETNAQDADPSNSKGPVFLALSTKHNKISVGFNIPCGTNETPEYNMTLQVPSSCVLKDFKTLATNALVDAGVWTAGSSFFIKRNATGAQIKDDEKTLDELEITDHSIVHLQIGVGCEPGEFLIRFEVDATEASGASAQPALPPSAEEAQSTQEDSAQNYIFFAEIPVKEKLTVLQLKEKLFAEWDALRGEKFNIPPLPSPNHIRIRDGKVGSQSGPLRDERSLSRCLLGLSDGRKLIIQILANPEIIGPDDLLLFVRLASYEKKTLSRRLDLFIPKKSTVSDLAAAIKARFPECMENPSDDVGAYPIGIAKAFSTGPPLSLKNALKLKWTDDAEQVNTAETMLQTIDKPPLSIRDGAVLVVRDTAGFLRAKEAARLRKEAAAANGEGGEGGVATESPLRGTLRPGTRGSRLRPSSSAKREKPMRIPGQQNSASSPMLPPSGEGSATPDDLGPMRSSRSEGEVVVPSDVPSNAARAIRALRQEAN